MRLERFLEDSARRSPTKVALVTRDERLTYAQVDAAANRVARALIARGIKPGDRVVVLLENTATCVAAIFGTLKAGAVLSVVNPTTKAARLAVILGNCRATALVTQARLVPEAAPAVASTPSVKTVLMTGPAGPHAVEIPGAEPFDAACAAESDSKPHMTGTDLDLATLGYTSGSTGVPKGVMHTHLSLSTAVDSVVEYLENTAQDVVLGVLPLSFGYGLNQLLTMCRVGGTLVLEKSFAYPQMTLQALKNERVTGFALVPTIGAMLLQMKDLRPGSLPDLRYVTNAAAAMSPAHLLRLQELLPTTRIYSMYGQTECTRTLYLPPDELRTRPGSVGIAIPGTEAYVVDNDGHRVGPNTVGELVVRGGHLMKGYWENPEATDAALRPGPHPWEKVLYTGDLFRTDDEGYLYFVARKDDIIKIKGQKVSPKEVEDVLYRIPGVRDAMVVGVPDPLVGNVLVAVIVPTAAGAVSDAEVKRHCAANLEDVMVPSRVEFRDDLPKTASGKLLRREVQKELAERAGGGSTAAAAVPAPHGGAAGQTAPIASAS